MIFKCMHLATACFKEFALHRAIWLRALHAIKKETSNLLQQEAKAADPWQVHSGPKAGEDLWEQGELNSKADSPLQANGKTMPPCKQIEMRCCCSLYLFIVVKKCTKTINKNAFPLEIPKSYLENRRLMTALQGFIGRRARSWKGSLDGTSQLGDFCAAQNHQPLEVWGFSYVNKFLQIWLNMI